MPNIVRENHDNLNVTLTLTIPTEEYAPDFKAQLNKYRKEAHLKGFRKGKTPLSVVRKMYGKRTLVDLINKKMGEAINDYIIKEKLDILGHPIPSKDQVQYDFDTKDLEDFEFKFDLGLAPDFEIVGLEDTAFNRYAVTIPDSMIDGDLKDAQKRLGEQMSVEDEIQEDDIIKLQADELEGDRIKEGGWANEFSVSYPELTEEAKAVFKGKRKGDLVQFDIFNLAKDKDEKFVKKYFLDVNEDAAENPVIGNAFQAVITDITRLVPAELNQAFFDKYFGENQVNSEAEAREKMATNIKVFYDRQADAFLFNEIKTTLEEKNPLTFPEEFLKRWMVASENLPKGKTPEKGLEEMTDGLVWNLIRGKLAKRFEIQVTEEEIKDRVRAQIMQYMGGYDLGNVINDYVEKVMKDEQQYHNARTQVLSDKLFHALKEVITVNENSVSTEEFDKIIEEEKAKNQPPAPEAIAAENPEEGIEEAEIVD